jgi:hypothetical protein
MASSSNMHCAGAALELRGVEHDQLVGVFDGGREMKLSVPPSSTTSARPVARLERAQLRTPAPSSPSRVL